MSKLHSIFARVLLPAAALLTNLGGCSESDSQDSDAAANPAVVDSCEHAAPRCLGDTALSCVDAGEVRSDCLARGQICVEGRGCIAPELDASGLPEAGQLTDSGAPDASLGCPGLEPAAQCTVVPQCGCATGSMCVPASASGGGKCVPAGTVANGAACKNNAECVPGSGCATQFYGAGPKLSVCGTYSKMCSDPFVVWSTPAGVDGASSTVSGLEICLTTYCDTVNPQKPQAAPNNFIACGAGAACERMSRGQVAFTACVKAGSTPLGGACTYGVSVCEAGAICESSSSASLCRRSCWQASDCTTGPNPSCSGMACTYYSCSGASGVSSPGTCRSTTEIGTP